MQNEELVVKSSGNSAKAVALQKQIDLRRLMDRLAYLEALLTSHHVSCCDLIQAVIGVDQLLLVAAVITTCEMVKSCLADREAWWASRVADIVHTTENEGMLNFPYSSTWAGIHATLSTYSVLCKHTSSAIFRSQRVLTNNSRQL